LPLILRELGGNIEVNHRIENLRDLPKIARCPSGRFGLGVFCESPVNNCRRAISPQTGIIFDTRLEFFKIDYCAE